MIDVFLVLMRLSVGKNKSTASFCALNAYIVCKYLDSKVLRKLNGVIFKIFVTQLIIDLLCIYFMSYRFLLSTNM